MRNKDGIACKLVSKQAVGGSVRMKNKLNVEMHTVSVHKIVFVMSRYYERASAASERVHTEIRENPEYERPAGRPAGRPWGRSSKAHI